MIATKPTTLGTCPICRDSSIKVKVYIKKGDGRAMRASICLNKGCGYKTAYPIYKDMLDNSLLKFIRTLNGGR